MRLAFDFELDVLDRLLTSLFSIAYLPDFAGPLSIHGTTDGATKRMTIWAHHGAPA